MHRHGDKKKQIVGEIYPQKSLEQVPYPNFLSSYQIGMSWVYRMRNSSYAEDTTHLNKW